MAKDEIGSKRPSWSDKTPAKPSVAVALDYKKPGGVSTPRIAASGRGAVAEQILAIAFAKGIPVREDADLVEILSTVDVDSDVPIDALAAVAEILSYLYRHNRSTAEAGAAGKEETTGTERTGREL
ncbi:MAG TPA: EscU/YscU/HrcU family type III secretion system export apparatus switch protein [Dongiaceae bacterium]|nr:EscU/YscU/HrcU family type III secretion system export apparatus switch protein [Dongiaceae bacterium]